MDSQYVGKQQPPVDNTPNPKNHLHTILVVGMLVLAGVILLATYGKTIGQLSISNYESKAGSCEQIYKFANCVATPGCYYDGGKCHTVGGGDGGGGENPPGAPDVSGMSCTGTITWTSTDSQGYWVDISDVSNFGGNNARFWNKRAGMSQNVTAPDGFNGAGSVSGLLTLASNTTYYVRVYSVSTGKQSPTAQFKTPNNCTGSSSTPTPTPTPPSGGDLSAPEVKMLCVKNLGNPAFRISWPQGVNVTRAVYLEWDGRDWNPARLYRDVSRDSNSTVLIDAHNNLIYWYPRNTGLFTEGGRRSGFQIQSGEKYSPITKVTYNNCNDQQAGQTLRNDAQIVKVENPPPTHMDNNKSWTSKITVKNTGNTVWGYSAGGGPVLGLVMSDGRYFCGSMNNTCGYEVGWIGSYGKGNEIVFPGETYTFTYRIKSSDKDADYNIRWQMYMWNGVGGDPFGYPNKDYQNYRHFTPFGDRTVDYPVRVD